MASVVKTSHRLAIGIMSCIAGFVLLANCMVYFAFSAGILKGVSFAMPEEVSLCGMLISIPLIATGNYMIIRHHLVT